jgi:hypothetical protein
MQKYEYKCSSILGGGEKTTLVLNQYGQQGWELVNTWFMWFYFKGICQISLKTKDRGRSHGPFVCTYTDSISFK